jgi:hypothetical protein
MRLSIAGFGLLLAALSLGATVPASAEFFNCNQRPGQVLYSNSYSGSPGQYSGSRTTSSRYTASYSASRSRYQAHASYSGSRHYWNDRGRW